MLGKVCVIGGGIAGMYASYKLCEEYDVTLYERSGRLGGRILMVDFDGLRVVGGAGVGRYKYDKLLWKLCEELGVERSVYDAKSVYVGGIEVEFDVVEKVQELRGYRGGTFEECGRAVWGDSEYEKFVEYVGETDFEKADVEDVVEDYGFDRSFSSGFKAFGIDWDVFLGVFERRIREGGVRVVLNCGEGKVVKKRKYTVFGEEYDKVVVATGVGSICSLLGKSSLYDNVGCQPFVRVYARLNKDLRLKSRLAIAPFPVQKIIEMKPKVYMISYSDNAASAWWLGKNLREKIERTVKDVLGVTVKVLASKVVYWECGTHYFKVLDRKKYRNREEYLEKVCNPAKGLYIVGEAFSRNQGWCEGALESVERILV